MIIMYRNDTNGGLANQYVCIMDTSLYIMRIKKKHNASLSYLPL